MIANVSDPKTNPVKAGGHGLSGAKRNFPIFSPEFVLLGRPPMRHRDPFDRMIRAQSIVNALSVMTDDPKFLK